MRDDTPGPGSNVPDSVWRKWYRAALVSRIGLESAQAEVKSKNRIYRADLKSAKKSGVDTEALIAALNARLLDADEVVIRERNKLKMLELSGVLSADEINDITGYSIEAPTSEEAGEIAAGRAAERGYQAGRSNQPRDANPNSPGTEAHVAWDKSWLAAQSDIAEEMQPGAARPASTAREKPHVEA